MMRFHPGVLAALLYTILQPWILEVYCLDECPNHLPTLTAPSPGLRNLPRHIQAIVPAYQFTCHGTITQWNALVMGAMHNSIIFQVWRLQGRGYYQLVGGNEGALQRMGFPEKVTLDVPENDRIHVLPGDVVGFYVGGEGDMSIKYSESGQFVRVVTYIKYESPGSLSNFYTPEINPVFAMAMLGSPMVQAVVEKEDIIPSPSPTTQINIITCADSSQTASVRTATCSPSPICASASTQPEPSSTNHPVDAKKEGSSSLSTNQVILISTTVVAFLLLCIVILLVVILVLCLSGVCRRKRRRGTNIARHLEVSQSGSYISSLTTSLGIRLRRLRPGYSNVVVHQSPPALDQTPPYKAPQKGITVTALPNGGETAEVRERAFEESDYVDMGGGGSITELCQKERVKLYGNPCYAASTSDSIQSLPIPEEETVYEDPDALLGPSGEYAMAVIVPYEYEQPSCDGSVYESIDRGHAYV